MKNIGGFQQNLVLQPDWNADNPFYVLLYNSKYLYLTYSNTNTTSIYKVLPNSKYDREDSPGSVQSVELVCIEDGGGYIYDGDEVKIEYFNGFKVDENALLNFSQYPELT